MVNRLLLVFLLLSLTIACKNQSSENSFFPEIKSLEYSRSSSPAAWISLYETLPSQQERAELLTSAAKLKSDSLLPFFADVIADSSAGSIYKQALFAIGQAGSPAAEDLLLSLPFESFSEEFRKQYIQSLAHCCSKKSIPFFTGLISSEYGNDALTALALCQKRKISSSVPDSIGHPSHAYYLSQAAHDKNIPNLVHMLPHQPELAKKYIFKTLLQRAVADSSRFTRWLRSDSLASPMLLNHLNTSLSSKADWKQKLYAIQLIPYLRDSVLAQVSKSFLQSQNNHLRIAALKTHVQFQDSEAAGSFILSRLNSEKNMYLRGVMLGMLAEINNETAYRIIMQDLDRGDDSYKILMLDALAKTGLKSGVNTLRQFVNVPNPRLANRAFENLSTLRKARTSELKTMLDSDSFSSVSLGLEWANTHKRSVGAQQLMELYSKFDSPKEFEVQAMVLRTLSRLGISPDSIQQSILWEQASHPFLYKRIFDTFPKVPWNHFEPKPCLSFLPGFLQPDSLVQYTQNPTILLKTSRGDISLELFPAQAPLTVKNFLSLAEGGFYQNLTFHRVIADFVIQGGDPGGDGWGGTEYLTPSEDNELSFVRGSIGIATSGFDTGSCQFFICHSEQPHLNGNYTNFGIVKSGIAVVDQILPGDKIIDVQIVVAD